MQEMGMGIDQSRQDSRAIEVPALQRAPRAPAQVPFVTDRGHTSILDQDCFRRRVGFIEQADPRIVKEQ
jgi:hypothetical protein